ncbi:MAG: 3',5'-cyclic-AMP phosphodiesterase [Cyanobacteria bacterium J06638_22]
MAQSVESSSSFLVLQLTDTHLFADEEAMMAGMQTVKSFQTIIERISTLPRRPDLVLLTGDLSQDESTKSYHRLRDAINALGIPAYAIPGNHDIIPVMTPILQGGQFRTGRSLQQQHWNLVLLDSVVPGQVAGRLAETELAFLDEQLAAHSILPALVTLHHPPCLINSTWMDDIGLLNAEEFFAVLDRHPQVKLVVFGHIHQKFEGERKGVRYLGAPSACVQFKPRSETFSLDETLPGYRLLTLHPDGQFDTVVKRVPFEGAVLKPIAS